MAFTVRNFIFTSRNFIFMLKTFIILITFSSLTTGGEIEIIHEFPEAQLPTHRTIYVRLGNQINFPCFVVNVSLPRRGMRLVPLMMEAVWKGPTGDIILSGSVDSMRTRIDSVKTIWIASARVKDTGYFTCIIPYAKTKTVEHVVDLIVYDIPHVALETPFVFKVTSSCPHQTHLMADLIDQIYEHLCGKPDVSQQWRQNCLYNISLVCQPYKTYDLIMSERNVHLKEIGHENLSTVIDKTKEEYKELKFKMPKIKKVKSKTMNENEAMVMLKIKRSVNQINSTLHQFHSQKNIAMNEKSSKNSIRPTQTDNTLFQTKSIFKTSTLSHLKLNSSTIKYSMQDQYKSTSSDLNQTIKSISSNPKFSTTEAFLSADEIGLSDEEKIRRRRIKLLKLLLNAVENDTGPDLSLLTSTESVTVDFLQFDVVSNSPELLVPTTTTPYVFTFTTAFVREEDREKEKLNEIYNEKNTRQIAVMYLLKSPDPLFDPLDCSDECTFKLRIHHISWHTDDIFKLVNFIALSSHLPNGVHLQPETILKGRVILFCYPGFSLKGNFCLPCLPGSHNSRNFFSRCELCPVDTFQESYGARECLKCPKGTRTKTQLGSYQSQDCIIQDDVVPYWRTATTLSLKIFLGLLLSIITFGFSFLFCEYMCHDSRAEEKNAVWEDLDVLRIRKEFKLEDKNMVKLLGRDKMEPAPGIKPKTSNKRIGLVRNKNKNSKNKSMKINLNFKNEFEM
ncbi:hypothetical protein HELRODRAFT_179241 [Helobdella robusta]|uniref:Ig-like domain-containing protein n=1 Tax=Helobdella robusta TaxID=6412 RepID=T1FEE9_HELRO|nr:hypothetical protein HELRODRAFT_179241 [Helobdella robusta]ESN95472.1 hypothetical protein HELRODRAFT_179241 [Helobdella robusta]